MSPTMQQELLDTCCQSLNCVDHHELPSGKTAEKEAHQFTQLEDPLAVAV